MVSVWAHRNGFSEDSLCTQTFSSWIPSHPSLWPQCFPPENWKPKPPTAHQMLSQMHVGCVTPAADPSSQKQGGGRSSLGTSWWSGNFNSEDVTVDLIFWTSRILIDGWLYLGSQLQAEGNAELLSPCILIPATGNFLWAGRAAQHIQQVVFSLSMHKQYSSHSAVMWNIWPNVMSFLPTNVNCWQQTQAEQFHLLNIC